MSKVATDLIIEKNIELLRRVKELEKKCKKLTAENAKLKDLLSGKKKTSESAIVEFLLKNPTLARKIAAKNLGVSVYTIDRVCHKYKIGKINCYRNKHKDDQNAE